MAKYIFEEIRRLRMELLVGGINDTPVKMEIELEISNWIDNLMLIC